MSILKLSIKNRLIFVIGFLSLLLIAIGTLGLTSLATTNSSLKVVYEHNVKNLEVLERMVSMINENQILVSESFAGQMSDFPEETSAVDRRIVTIKQNVQDIDAIFIAYRDQVTDERERALAEAFDKNRKSYGFQGLLPAVAALVAHDFQQTGELLQGPMREFYPAVRGAAQALIALQMEQASNRFEESQYRYQTVRNVAIAVIIAGVGFASFIGLLVIRAISSPLAEAVSVAQSVAEGDLTRQIDVTSQDETGQLMSAMQRMTESLSGIVSTVRTSAETIINSSRDIASGNGELAKRTELQASSLQEAASSMEELTTTVKTNAENAQQANELVMASAEIARRGGAVVAKVVDTMASIKDSSSRIKDIVGVIDSISFQTNLLALNAAVEAARAGEQGRGFAVVAGEVRNLAQRSTEAAKEIKDLIDDSVNKVEAGNNLVATAGSTMEEIVQSVIGVTDIMREIASASQQQSAGIELVNNSVSRMDQTTQQNAAMVEEAAVAAENLQHQAQELSRAVSVFQLEHSAAFRTQVSKRDPDSRPNDKATKGRFAPDLGGLALG